MKAKLLPIAVLMCIIFNVNGQSYLPLMWDGGGGAERLEVCGFNSTASYIGIYVPPGHYNPSLTYVWKQRIPSCDGSTVLATIPGYPIYGTNGITTNVTGEYFCEVYNASQQLVALSWPVYVFNASLNGGICASTASRCLSPNLILKINEINTWSMGNSVSTVSFNWQLNGVDVPGASSTSFSPNVAGIYRVRFTTHCETAYSNEITVTNGVPAFTVTISGASGVCQGSGTTLQVLVNGAAPPPSYWINWSTGATTASAVVTTQGTYTVTVTEDNACPASASKGISQHNPVSPVVSPSGPLTICSGSSVKLTASASGIYTRQWTRDGVNITGATAVDYYATATGNYRVRMTNECGSYTSSPVSVTVVTNSGVTASITASGATSFCAGGSVLLTASATGSGLTYQWKKDNINIQGAVNSTLSAASTGSYQVVVTNICSTSVTSNSISVQSYSGVPARPGNINGLSKVCFYQQGVVYSVAGVANATGYTWTVPAAATITSGQGTNTITVNFGNKVGTLSVVAVNPCGAGVARTKNISKGTNCRLGSFEEMSFPDSEPLLTVFPNPVKDKLNLRLSLDTESDYSITLFDFSGKTVYSASEYISAGQTVKSIDVNHLNPGLYYIHITAGEKSEIRKVILFGN